MLALSLAASDISVGLIETTKRLPHTFLLSGGYENLDAVFWESDLDSPEFLNMVARFRNARDFVLINATASVLLKTTGPAGWVRRCLVPTTIRAQDLLSAYGAIKNASKKWAISEVELVVIKECSTDNAAGAAVVLEKMARRFLPCSVRFVGAVTLAADIDALGALSSMPPLQALPDGAAAEIRDVARNLIVSGGSQKKRRPHVEKCI
jgi:MinD-like ATPase involved in chromosome partitioning or flagellar assembly